MLQTALFVRHYMRRKRLNHTVDILCDMFCGWRLMNSYTEIERIGTGKLEIDIITGVCIFNDSQIESLSIAYELNAWVKEDFEKHNITLADIQTVKLVANLTLETSLAQKASQSSFYIGKDGKPIEKGSFYNLSAKLHSIVKTNDAIYQNERTHYETWPVGWPNT